MFSAKNFNEGAQKFEVAAQHVLNAVQEELDLFKGIDVYFTVVAKDDKRGSTKLELNSEPLPLTLFNVGAYAYKNVRLEISGSLPNDKENEGVFGVGIRYTHRNGGSNGCRIANKGQTSLRIIYNQIAEETKVETDNYILSNAIRTLEIYLRSYKESEKVFSIINEIKPYFRKDAIGREDMKNLLPLLKELEAHSSRYYTNTDLDNFDIREVGEAKKDLQFAISEFEEVIV